jgi:release factor glutamine methyltransferase
MVAAPGSAPAAVEQTIAGAVNAGARRLIESGIDTPRLEARLLLAHALGCTSEDLIRDRQARIDPADFAALIARRAAREPLAYILGWREFWSLRFAVSPATLIPRADSESVVAAALRRFTDEFAAPRVLDLGCGTGCLLLAFLHERPRAFGVGVDFSESATQLARGNAAALGLADRAAFFRGTWSDAIGGRFDLVLSNPPYIPTLGIAGLMPDVARHEPALALDGGGDGLDAYRRIVAAMPGLLAPSGHAVLETGIGQLAAVAALASAVGFEYAAHRDLAGVDRAIILRWPP